jgi:hypothetical protein
VTVGFGKDDVVYNPLQSRPRNLTLPFVVLCKTEAKEVPLDDLINYKAYIL